MHEEAFLGNFTVCLQIGGVSFFKPSILLSRCSITFWRSKPGKSSKPYIKCNRRCAVSHKNIARLVLSIHRQIHSKLNLGNLWYLAQCDSERITTDDRVANSIPAISP